MKPKFLIVDDHADLRALLAATLMGHGCDTEEAEDGAEALKRLEDPEEAKQFDAVFLDIMMPNLSGYAVVAQMRKWAHTKDIPVIMLSAKDADTDFIEGYQSGATYYISKPFTNAQIAFGLDLVFGEGDQAVNAS